MRHNRIQGLLRHWWPTLVLVWSLVAGCSNSPNTAPVPEHPPTPAAIAPSARSTAAPLKYIEHLAGDAEPAEAVPWVVAVHGLGDRPEAFARLFGGLDTKARIVFPRAPEPWGPGFAWFPYRFRDQNPDELAQGIEKAADQIADLIMHLQAADSKYARKPVICGFSQGGMLSFAVALKYPQLISGAVPISGLITPQLAEQTQAKTAPWPPIRAMHGTADTVVPLAPTLEAIGHLAERGISIELKQYEGVPHTINRAMRKQLYLWLEQMTAEAAQAPVGRAGP